MAPNQYEMPAFGTTGDRLLGWLLEAKQEGDAWLSAQRPTQEWDKVIDLLGASDPSKDIKGLSNTGYNLVERNARDLVASLANFRHEGEFRPQWDKALYDTAHVLTKLDRHWHTETHAYDVHRENIQNAVAFGTGYLVEDYDKAYWGTFGDIRLRAFGPSDVTFVQLPKNHDIQKAYMVIIREELPLNLAKATYENFADRLVPDRDAPGWIQKGLRAVQNLMGGSPFLRFAGTTRKDQQGSFPTLDVFHAYILDRSVNQAPVPVQMGPAGANWSYTVPALNDPLPTGIMNPSTGEQFTRPALAQDCRLFPLRRYAVFTQTTILSDGSSPWWHGDAPVARTRFNDWAWEALGKSLLSDSRTMQDGIVAIMRYIEDACAARLDPAMLINENLASEGFGKTFNPRMAGVRASANLDAGDVVKFPVPLGHYEVPPFITEYIKAQEQRINHQMGTPDLVAIAKAKQVPGEGTLEKLMEMAGPLVQDMVRALETPLHHLGKWRLAYYFQFYTRSRLIRIAGTDETEAAEEFEFKPTMLVPEMAGEGLDQRTKRSRLLLDEFKYSLTESGINEMHRMINRLALLQLKKAGVKIDSWTIAKAWKLPNYGPEPEGTKNMMQRWVAEMHMDRELAEEMGGGPAGGGGRGRPPSNQKPPQLVSKDGGTRQTIKNIVTIKVSVPDVVVLIRMCQWAKHRALTCPIPCIIGRKAVMCSKCLARTPRFPVVPHVCPRGPSSSPWPDRSRAEA